MSEPTPRYWQIFFELFESLPRQGPGNRACAERALALCHELPATPNVLDLGCGVGSQTFHLAELTAGCITAIESHAPFVDRLRRAVTERGLSGRVRPAVGDMTRLDLAPASFDLIWSEGALYFVGLGEALGICYSFLRPGGYLAFTDAVWRKKYPPQELREAFEFEFAAIRWAADTLALIEKSGLDLVGHFTLPDAAWWDDFYTPMERRIGELRAKYAADNEDVAIVDQLAHEPELRRRYSDYYGYEFYVARRGR